MGRSNMMFSTKTFRSVRKVSLLVLLSATNVTALLYCSTCLYSGLMSEVTERECDWLLSATICHGCLADAQLGKMWQCSNTDCTSVFCKPECVTKDYNKLLG